jgi:hypothetical protein
MVASKGLMRGGSKELEKKCKKNKKEKIRGNKKNLFPNTDQKILTKVR